MGNFAKEVKDENFNTNVLNSDKPVLVDFWAGWCGPCRMIAPTIEAVAEDFDGKADVFKMNVDYNIDIPQRYGVRGIPTLIIFNEGEEQERIVGAASKEAISRIIEKHIAADSAVV